MDHADFEPPLFAATVMNGFGKPWGIAGGWGIDLLAGRLTRQHADVDVVILRDHLIPLRRYLSDWTFCYVLNRQSIKWDGQQLLMLPVHELHATHRSGRTIEFLLNESDGIDWIYRRDASIRLNLSQWLTRGAFHVPVMAPELILLFKSESPGAKDELDRRTIWPLVCGSAKQWLGEAVARSAPGHPWVLSEPDA